MAVKTKTPNAAPEPVPEAKVIEVTVGYGCSLIDPLTKETYSTFPKPLVASAWTDTQLALGNLIEAK
ncbi:hypothetical protein [Ferribacterium limneticum]|uniref:hypothetical protein n=1 Tax=Ferribacterium limneticum TaxID=76259 RepID=UPI001CF83DEF|nr:hypothetical protein [Ferribacterium limneticum]UCV26795.1 hypothetical protein KI617_10780 [Ferribacterium limneticum]UCV30712.1 hypothetical protein KI608_10780 [Ferribacterium limneticum]